MATSESKFRTVEVRGTTWITDGSAFKMRWAVTTTAGWRKPASRPSGSPRSRSTTSPDVGIEPGCLVVSERSGELAAHTVLSKRPNRERHRTSHGRPEVLGQPLELFVGLSIDPHTRRLHANQHTHGDRTPMNGQPDLRSCL